MSPGVPKSWEQRLSRMFLSYMAYQKRWSWIDLQPWFPDSRLRVCLNFQCRWPLQRRLIHREMVKWWGLMLCWKISWGILFHRIQMIGRLGSLLRNFHKTKLHLLWLNSPHSLFNKVFIPVLTLWSLFQAYRLRMGLFSIFKIFKHL